MRSLYVHVPFCAHRCGYCAFVTTDERPELHTRYVAGLQREFQARQHELSGTDSFDTIFIGGGTPTLLALPDLKCLLTWLQALLKTDGELTIECNPETVSSELAATLVQGGVSRVSLGAQSFTPHVLEVLERRARPETVRQAVAELRSAGIKQLNLDVLWGVPGQTADDHVRDLQEVIALQPDHVSAYELEFKPGTRLTRRFGSSEAAVGDAADDMYDRVVNTLERAGYHWYETANFAREERVCRHNMTYWNAQDHMGIGIGAVGTIAGERRTNNANIVRWLEATEQGLDVPAKVERLDERTQRLERTMLSLRLDRVTHIDARDIDDGIVIRAGLDRLDELQLADITWHDSGDVDLRLLRRGRMLLNSVLGMVLDMGE